MVLRRTFILRRSIDNKSKSDIKSLEQYSPTSFKLVKSFLKKIYVIWRNF